MKTNELRVGNWVFNDGKLHAIIGNDLLWENDCPFDPIPLTQGWIERFGFDQDERTMSLDDKAELFLERQGEELWLVCSSGLPQEIKKLKYVHQLQNLYFALTGEELKPTGI